MPSQGHPFLWFTMLFVCIKTLFVFSFCHLVYSCDMKVLINPNWYLLSHSAILLYMQSMSISENYRYGHALYDKGPLETCWKKEKQNSCIIHIVLTAIYTLTTCHTESSNAAAGL
jgi:accessory gene regulator protein AgrB